MRDSIRVIDDFCPSARAVRDSALAAGFGTWAPSKGYVGSSRYEGMGFWGRHADMVAALAVAMGTQIAPNSMFFRVTNEDTEAAYVHSDRESGAYTCVVYLSDHEDDFGTAFYRHRATGLVEMPTFAEMHGNPEFDQLRVDMVEGGDKAWERLDVVRGRFNRAVIFRAPLFHARNPRHGFGIGEHDGRMVWVTHFHTPATLKLEN